MLRKGRKRVGSGCMLAVATQMFLHCTALQLCRVGYMGLAVRQGRTAVTFVPGGFCHACKGCMALGGMFDSLDMPCS